MFSTAADEDVDDDVYEIDASVEVVTAPAADAVELLQASPL